METEKVMESICNSAQLFLEAREQGTTEAFHRALQFHVKVVDVVHFVFAEIRHGVPVTIVSQSPKELQPGEVVHDLGFCPGMYFERNNLMFSAAIPPVTSWSSQRQFYVESGFHNAVMVYESINREKDRESLYRFARAGNTGAVDDLQEALRFHLACVGADRYALTKSEASTPVVVVAHGDNIPEPGVDLTDAPELADRSRTEPDIIRPLAGEGWDLVLSKAGFTLWIDNTNEAAQFNRDQVDWLNRGLVAAIEVLEGIAAHVKLEREAEQSKIEGLTQLFRREYFLRLLEKALKRSVVRKFWIFLIDIDYFKTSVNDRYDHGVGDEVLRIVGQVMRVNVRADDFVAAYDDMPPELEVQADQDSYQGVYGRYGGEEFTAAGPGGIEVGLKVAKRIAHRVRFASRQYFAKINQSAAYREQAKHTQEITLSIGVCEINTRKLLDTARYIQWADKAMYRAKYRGRDRIMQVYQVELPDQVTQYVEHFSNKSTQTLVIVD